MLIDNASVYASSSVFNVIIVILVDHVHFHHDGYELVALWLTKRFDVTTNATADRC